jgi:MoCo/4Fe-4S cofactor protein with predicted Tat translocation signal
MSITREEHTGSAAAAGNKPRSALDLPALRAKLAEGNGREQWRSLEELADTEEFQALIHNEFPEQVTQLLDPVGRRSFLKLMGASLALAGASACTKQPDEKIFPYVKQPEYVVPGVPLYFATAMPFDGVGQGVLVESHMGRPTKVEGNPDHPASLGATDLFAQASVLTLYDPERSQVVRNIGEVQTWSNFNIAVAKLLADQKAKQGAGLHFLSQPITSPTVARQRQALLAAYPQAKWHQVAVAGNEAAHAATKIAFGRPLDVVPHFDKADRILSLDADFLGSGPGMVRAVKDFTSRRRVEPGGGSMNRLYVAETAPTNTGACADHRLPLRPSEIGELALGIARGLGLPVRAPVDMDAHQEWIGAVVKDLQANRGRSVVVAGPWQPAGVHLLAAAMNQVLSAEGTTVTYIDPIAGDASTQTDSLRALADAMEAGQVDVLVMLEVNPVYDAPADLEFHKRLGKVGTRIHYGLYYDETGELSHWHVPATHYLEAWGDVRAFDGTSSIVQPLIAPLYDGKSLPQVMAGLLGDGTKTSFELVRQTWTGALTGGDFESAWRKVVHDGVIPATASVPVQPAWTGLPNAWGATAIAKPAERAKDSLDVVYRPDSSMFDGRFANNAWLQEVPKAMTRLTWDNPALIAPSTAEKLGLDTGALIDLTIDGRQLQVPVWIQPGQATDTLTLYLGFGRSKAGSVGNDVGFNTYQLRTSTAPWSVTGASAVKVGRHYKLACTQDHHSMHGRNLARVGTLTEFQKDPEFAATEDMRKKSMYPGFKYEGYAWGMTVDLSTCVGCNACIIACQAENNIPTVGKDQVSRGREMQWIRIDRYFTGDNLDTPETVLQPVFCQHCEQAPCEGVCPVNATVHDDDGLNAMVYNRCVGTRYCSNNCPYKVRRFNFTLYNDPQSPVTEMVFNPDVTVRSRGVMEKCTYCVQRINFAKNAAIREQRKVTDGEILTACQQVCPADALTFGDINDDNAKVTKLKKDPRNYTLLNDLGTLPRTTYLAGVTNPNPDLARG